MKNNKPLQLLTGLMILTLGILPYVSFGQDPGGGPDAPIDGGVSILVAAGVAYGVKKYRENRKQGNNE